MKLTMDEIEMLNELYTSDGYKVYINKVLPQLIKRHEEKVLAANVDSPAAGHILMIEKARLEGARALIADISILKGRRGTP